MERFGCKTEIISGAGAVRELEKMGFKRILIVADPFFVKNGVAAKLAVMAPQSEIFDRVEPDPGVELAAQGVARVKEFNPDAIVALGGGSAMDCAKAMRYFAGSDAKLIAVPTTSGSGSEATDFAILTHKGVKHPLVDEKLKPDAALLDSELLQKLPPSLVADTGFDALCHAVESFVATGATPITDALAQSAFSQVFGLLPASFGGNAAVRPQIHLAATMAGMAFSQSGLGLCHAMAHALGGEFHIPHGRLNAILLPAVIDANARGAGEKYAWLARFAGLGGSAEVMGVRNLKNALIRLRRELGMPENLQQAGVAPALVWHRSRDIVQAVLADPCCKTNPVLVEDFMVRRILEAVTGRG